MLADQVDYVVGVDTHRDEHVLAVVVAPTGAIVAQRSVRANARGYAQALRFAEEHADGARVDILFDKCPRASALIRRPVVLEEALAALWRKLPVVYYNVTWAQGKHWAINHKTVAVGQAVKLALVPGDAGKFYRAALPFCGTTVAQNSWAFRVGFANAPNVIAAGHIAFLAKTRDGWRLYGGATS